jgi:hypothetical protein
MCGRQFTDYDYIWIFSNIVHPKTCVEQNQDKISTVYVA